MRRIAELLEEWYEFPVGPMFAIPIMLGFVLLGVGCIGDIALKLIF